MVLFIGIHLLPTVVPLRQVLILKLGEKAYQGIFSLFAVAGFTLIILGMVNSTASVLWSPPQWGKTLTVPLMLISMVLLAASHMKTNIKLLSHHPLSWAVFFCALAHVLVNNELHTNLLFASFGAFALLAMLSATLRGVKFEVIKYPFTKDLLVLLAGIVNFALFAGLHRYLFGVEVLQ